MSKATFLSEDLEQAYYELKAAESYFNEATGDAVDEAVHRLNAAKTKLKRVMKELGIT